MKKILMFGMSSCPGGIENFIKNYFLNEEFSKLYHIDFVCYENSLAYDNEIKKFGHNILYVSHQKKHPLKYISDCKKIIKDGNYDYAYFNLMSAANIKPVKIAKSYNIPVVLHSHFSDIVLGFLRKILHLFNRKKMVKCATHRFACSVDAGKTLFKNEDFIVINNAIDIDRFKYSEIKRKKLKEKYNIPDNALILGTVGRLAIQKNQKFLIEIFKDLQNSNSNSYLFIIGSGVLESELKNLVENYSLSERVFFITDCNDASAYYSLFDIFIMTSIFEGISIVSIEAQISGCKCLLSSKIPSEANVSGLAEFLPINNTEIWIDKINSFTFDKNRENACKKFYNTNYDITNEIKKMIAILGE